MGGSPSTSATASASQRQKKEEHARRTTHAKEVNEPIPRKPEFDSPWRKMPWGQKHELEQKLSSFTLRNIKAPYVRILLVGQVGVGKSSFINSVNNAFQKRITTGALTATGSEKSFTKTYTTHCIEREDGTRMPFVFNDIMGLESDEYEGVHTKDIESAVQGFLQEGYKFNPLSAATGDDCRSNPTLEEQTFCLVNVIAADRVSIMSDDVIAKLKYIRMVATLNNMPQVIIMTRPDLTCPLVNKNLQTIYTSKKIKTKMQECSNMLGIPMNHIFPVKNYHEEIDTDDDMDLLILKALEQIVYTAADAMRKKNFEIR